MKVTVTASSHNRGGLTPAKSYADVEVDYPAENPAGHAPTVEKLIESGTRAARELLAGLGVVASDAITVDLPEPIRMTGHHDPGVIGAALAPALVDIELLEEALEDGAAAARRSKSTGDEVAAYRTTLETATKLAARLRRALVGAGAGQGPDDEASSHPGPRTADWQPEGSAALERGGQTARDRAHGRDPGPQ